MYDIFNELTNFSTMYTLYASFLIGLTFRLIWIWNIEYHFLDTVCSSSDISIEQECDSLEKTHYSQTHPALVWICRYIRRKVAASDETESFIPPTPR